MKALHNIGSGSGGNVIYGVTTVNGQNGDVNISKETVGLSNLTNDPQIKRTEMAIPNGVATLDTNGKVPIIQMNSQLAHVVSVPNKAARLALSNNSVLMVCLQADTQWMWALNANLNPAVESNWIDCGSTAASVISVNGATGAITISCSTLGAVPISRKVNNKALSGDIVLSLADIIALPNDANKYLNGQGQWVKITSLATADPVELNWCYAIGSGASQNHNGGQRLWSYDKAYGLVLPAGSSHKITKLVWEQNSNGPTLSNATFYVGVYSSANALKSYTQMTGINCTPSVPVTITLTSALNVSNGDKLFVLIPTGSAYPASRYNSGSTKYDSSDVGFSALPASIPSMLTYTNNLAGFYFVMSYIPV